MYDILTTTYLFFLLCPGVLLTLGTSSIMAAAIHAVVFYVILQYVSLYVPWWAVWVIGVPLVTYKVYSGSV
jgi:hypothetical protein